MNNSGLLPSLILRRIYSLLTLMYTNPNLGDCNRTWTHNHLVKLAKWLSCVMSTYLYGAIDCVFLSCYECVWSESTLCNGLNVKELLARSRCEIWKLIDCNGTRNHDHFVHKLSGCGFEPHSSHLSFRYRTWFERGVS